MRGREAWAAAAAVFAIGWGANQFAPMVVLYQSAAGVSAAASQTMFVLYAVGLVPGLFVGGPLSDRRGRRAVVLAALLLSVASSLLLMLGDQHSAWLYLGRVLAGIASGVGFGAGAAWVKETTAGTHGARRAVVAMTGGFALGPLIAGLAAARMPEPLVWSYLPHVIVTVLAVAMVLSVAEPRTRVASAPPGPQPAAAAAPLLLGDPRFRRVVAPLAPWVFLTASVALAALPPAVRGPAGGHEVLFSALVTPVPALAGIGVQTVAARLHGRLRPQLLGGFAGAAGGLLVAAWAVATGSLGGVVAACVLLGAAYGLCQTTGLAEVATLSAPTRLGHNTAIYQALTYLGYLAPLPIVVIAAWSGMPEVLAALAALAVLTWWFTDTSARRLA